MRWQATRNRILGVGVSPEVVFRPYPLPKPRAPAIGQAEHGECRRLEDRVYRLGTDYAWSQQPASRTSRIVSNVAAFETADDAVVMTRSTFLVTEFHAGDYRSWAGWTGHRLRRNGDGWEFLVKQVNLINYDQNLRNPSITL